MLTSCPACSSLLISSVTPELTRCADCDHIFQNPPTVGASYDFDYVNKAYDRCPSLMEMAHLRVGFLRGFCHGGRLLDVGYGNGAFVKTALKAGFDAYGADIHGHDYGVREADITDHSENWDIVTFFDSMEHFPDLQLVKNLVDRAKVVLVSVPWRPDSFPADLTWRHYKPGEHLHYFSNDSLKAVVRKDMLWLPCNLEDTIRKNPKHVNIKTVIFGK